MSKPFGLRGAEIDGAGGAYGGGRAVGRGDQDEKYWAPEMPPGAEDYHGCKFSLFSLSSVSRPWLLVG